MQFSHKLVTAASIALLSSSAFGNLLLHYTFDEAASGNAAAIDTGMTPAASGNFLGSATRSNSTPSDLSLGSFSTNGGGSTNYLSGGDAGKLDGLTQITVATWINLQGAPIRSDRLLSDHSTSDGWDWYIENPSSGGLSATNFRLILAVDTVAGPTSGTVSADNQWVFVAATYDGSKTSANLNYYVGGTSDVLTRSGGGDLNAGPSNLNTADFRIGSTARTTNDRTPNALFDDVRVYDEVLSLSQLESIRLTSVPEPTTIALLSIAAAGLLRRSRP